MQKRRVRGNVDRDFSELRQPETGITPETVRRSPRESNPHLLQTALSYPAPEPVPQEVPQLQGVTTQVQTHHGQSFRQEECIDLTLPKEYDEAHSITAQMGPGSVHPSSSQTNFPLFLGVASNFPVLCPLGMLPCGACPWKGDYRYRKKHIDMHHRSHLIASNLIMLGPNNSTIMNVYGEYFLCYTFVTNWPAKLYCIVQHACTSRDCMLTFQYTCAIFAENKYEKIYVTRLVGHFQDNFSTLTEKGNYVSLDSTVVKSFTNTKGFYVYFTVLIPEEV
jgi:hypothetical protein